MRVLFICALSVIALPSVASAQPSDADVFKQILAARATHFSDLKGAPQGNDKDIWIGRIAPEGMRCSVLHTSTVKGDAYNQYGCTLIREETPVAEARSRFDHLKRSLALAEPGWLWFKNTADWAGGADIIEAGPAHNDYVASFTYLELLGTGTIDFDIDDVDMGSNDPVQQIPSPAHLRN